MSPGSAELASDTGPSLYWRWWEVEGATCALAVVHGLGEHSGRYAGLARSLNRHRVSVFAIDLRGMGLSSGPRGRLASWRDWEADFAALMAEVRSRHPDLEVVPLGHSFGALVVLTAILRGEVSCSRFVLSSPAFEPAIQISRLKLGVGRVASRLVPDLALSNQVQATHLTRLPQARRAYLEDPLVHDRISARLHAEWRRESRWAQGLADRVPVPFCLILGADDPLIDPAPSRRFATAVGARAELLEYPGRLHEPFHDLGSEEVMEDLARWLSEGRHR